MRSIERFMTQVRRRETPLHARLYDFAKRLRAIHIPVIPGVHHLLYEERRLRHSLWHTFLRICTMSRCLKHAVNRWAEICA